jgi:hypothetical protein
MFALLLRLAAQTMCRSPREIFPTFPLGGFLLMLLCFNGFSLYRHVSYGAVEGGAIILDFVGLGASKTSMSEHTSSSSYM